MQSRLDQACSGRLDAATILQPAIAAGEGVKCRGSSWDVVAGRGLPLPSPRRAPVRRHVSVVIWLVGCGVFVVASVLGVLAGEPCTSPIVLTAVALGLGLGAMHALGRKTLAAESFGPYRLIAPLGAGGMAQVYLAEHRLLRRPCAIKLIRPDRAGDPQAVARFEREVRTTARLSHGNTVEVYDSGRTADGTPFYVMEYLPGRSLEDLLQRHGPMPAARVVHLLRQACQALREAHDLGLVHRDLKPGNLFAAQRGGRYDVLKLLDFGLVKPVAEVLPARLTHEGAVSGTPLFMSPEQARGLPDLDARSDIYSLGAVAYALLTGRPPFDGTNPLDVMMAHVRDEVVPPSRHRADVPADLERVVLRCLAKRPEERFPDAGSLEQALAGCASADQWTQWDALLWWYANDPTAATPPARGETGSTPRSEGPSSVPHGCLLTRLLHKLHPSRFQKVASGTA